MEFYMPTETGEFLAFCAAGITVVMGLFMFLAPVTTFRILGLTQREGRHGALAEARSTMGGFYMGAGLAAMMLAQPMVYLALGGAFALAFFGRVLSMMSDDANSLANWVYLALQTGLAALPLGYAFGLL